MFLVQKMVTKSFFGPFPNASKTNASVSRLSSYFFQLVFNWNVCHNVFCSFNALAIIHSNIEKGLPLTNLLHRRTAMTMCQKRSFYHFDKCRSADTHLIITVILITYLTRSYFPNDADFLFSILRTQGSGLCRLGERNYRSPTTYHGHTTTTITTTT